MYTSEVFFSPTEDNLLGSLNCGNRAQGSVSEVRGSGSRPRGLPAAPPACHFDGKTQHFGDTGRHFPDSVENSDIY